MLERIYIALSQVQEITLYILLFAIIAEVVCMLIKPKRNMSWIKDVSDLAWVAYALELMAKCIIGMILIPKVGFIIGMTICTLFSGVWLVVKARDFLKRH